MSEAIIVAILSLLGTAAGSFASIMTSQKLTNYKIDELKRQVEKHNTIIERTYRLEERATLTEEQIKVANHRINDLEASALKREV